MIEKFEYYINFMFEENLIFDDGLINIILKIYLKNKMNIKTIMNFLNKVKLEHLNNSIKFFF
jgi:hypothetical protein